MRDSWIRGLTAVLLVVCLAAWYWRAQMGPASVSFAGPDFHSASVGDRDAVAAGLADYLAAQGFHEEAAAPAVGAVSGIHSAGETTRWFEKGVSDAKGIRVSVARDAAAVRTEIAWRDFGTKNSHRRAETDALQFAVGFDEWMNARPQKTTLPADILAKKSEWFRGELARCGGR